MSETNWEKAARRAEAIGALCRVAASFPEYRAAVGMMITELIGDFNELSAPRPALGGRPTPGDEK